MDILMNSNEMSDLSNLYKKFNGDKERDGYLIMNFLKNQDLLPENWTECNPHSLLYLYLCSIVESVLDESCTDSEFLSDEESELIDKIEEFIDYLE